MTKEFWSSGKRRLHMRLWASVFLLIGLAQLLSDRSRLYVVLFVLFGAGLGFRIAWRRASTPLYTIRDDGLVLSGMLYGTRLMRWEEIKEINQDGHIIRLVGREWIGSVEINLNHLGTTQRSELMDLVQSHASRNKIDLHLLTGR